MTALNTLRPAPGAVKPRKRVGRGPGSGHGKTASRGHKGLKSRSGGKPAPGFEGGQMPLQRRLPKRGFTNIFKIVYQLVNLQDLQDFAAHTVVTRALLQQAGKVKSGDKPVKILGDGSLTVPLTIQVDKFSKSAKQKIIAAGGTAEEQAS
ncbi:MAG: 50S ribosomal protein L15 [Candidatus Tectomicrobia bacterium]|uniref:Large ribosomal subunit protein uL15 n=1 Tax=Tectimicrobiota bacterium TaxID=2528274 RepID=A0A938B472_UNCTE|nr:50S ribosomal protein L15 [Candidatus Tectomicrobia bacterium]